MLEGLVQNDFPLTLQHILGRMRSVYGNSEVVTLTDDGPQRATYADVALRVDKLAHALTGLGIGESDRVATFAWNTQRHLEIYLAAPCMGAVLHTLNIRLFEDQLTYIANHAEDKIVFVDDSLVPLLEKVAPTFETVETYVVMGDGDAGSLPGKVLRYEDLLDEQTDEPFDWPELDEKQAAGLCYTSGTTGNPKGVLYSHKSNVLHSFGACTADAMALSSSDRMLPIVPMFHANAWGIPSAAALTGCALVTPNKFMQAEPLAKAIEAEKVTISAAVPTIWSDLLKCAEQHSPDLSSVDRVICGGAAVPLSLMQAWEQKHGLRIIQAWGMTETSPLGSVARPPAHLEGDEHWDFRNKAGRINPLVEARVVGDDGSEQPWDGETTGELQVRGPWIARAYYNDPSGDDKFDDGWLRTGDIAAVDH